MNAYAVLAVIFVLLIVSVYLSIFYSKSRQTFQVSMDATSEYIPQNMTETEYKTINEWDYPGYLNSAASKNRREPRNEKFDNIYPGGREDVNCADADVCDYFGPYIADPALQIGDERYLLENFR
jgi:hypothetical protein